MSAFTLEQSRVRSPRNLCNDEQGIKAKKIKVSDVLPQFVKLHVQSKCSLRENRLEVEDSINFATFFVSSVGDS